MQTAFALRLLCVALASCQVFAQDCVKARDCRGCQDMGCVWQEVRPFGTQCGKWCPMDAPCYGPNAAKNEIPVCPGETTAPPTPIDTCRKFTSCVTCTSDDCEWGATGCSKQCSTFDFGCIKAPFECPASCPALQDCQKCTAEKDSGCAWSGNKCYAGCPAGQECPLRCPTGRDTAFSGRASTVVPVGRTSAVERTPAPAGRPSAVRTSPPRTATPVESESTLPPVSAVRLLRVHGVTSSDVQLAWVAPEVGFDCASTEYSARLGTTVSGRSSWTSIVLENPSSPTLSLSSLDPDTDYTISVSAITGTSTGPATEIVLRTA